MKEKICYKIRHPNGSYSDGGRVPSFSKKGKVWPSVGALKCHLSYVVSTAVYDKCEVIPLVYTIRELSPVDFSQFIANTEDSK